MCANMAGSLLLVGSADGSLALQHSKLGSSDSSSSDAALHDMWAGGTCPGVSRQDLINELELTDVGVHALGSGSRALQIPI